MHKVYDGSACFGVDRSHDIYTLLRLAFLKDCRKLCFDSALSSCLGYPPWAEMRSRIPKSKSEKRRNQQSTESPTLSSGPETLDDRAAQILSSLQALGAPHLSQEEFSSIFTGPFADILLFIGEHMKGRQEVAHLRGQIHR